MGASVTPIEVFCDGSCLGNPGPGGWAALLRMRGDARGEPVHEKMLAGHAAATTNNQMELRAAIEGLKALTRACTVTVVTDSTYVIKGITEWRFGWQKNGWKNSKKQPVENLALWHELIAAVAPHQVTWKWVKGHSGHVDNERVDAAAQAQAQLARTSS